MMLWICSAREEWTDWNRVHRKLLLEISNYFKGFRINDFWTIISSSSQNSKIFTESNSINFGSLMCKKSIDKISLIIISADISIISTNKNSFIIDIPQSFSCNLHRFRIIRFDHSSILKLRFKTIRIHLSLFSLCI